MGPKADAMYAVLCDGEVWAVASSPIVLSIREDPRAIADDYCGEMQLPRRTRRVLRERRATRKCLVRTILFVFFICC